MLRLTITGYGAAHVLPGGGAAAATVTYEALRHRGFDPVRVGTALAAVSVLVYGALGAIFSGSLLYMILTRKLSLVETVASVLFLVLVFAVALGAYTARRSPMFSKNMVQRGVRMVGRLQGGTERQRKMETRTIRLISRLGEVLGEADRQLAGRRAEVLKLGALALGYWAFDALCLILMFDALGVTADPLVLLVAYGVATTIAAIPLTPGGIGVFEATVLATLALFGVSAEAAIPILGYRLFNFWLPIPLAAIFYPTLKLKDTRRDRGLGNG
jgi:hypothetical protein